jgi:hypothetical protein
LWTGLAVAVLFTASQVRAADEPDEGDDPPGRVARLSYLKGAVSLRPAGSDDESEDWTDATLNRPLTSGDKLWVERDGRAELQLGNSNVHLDRDTSFSFLELDDNVLQASLTEGAMHLQVRSLENDETIEVDTPHAAVIIRRPGDYHIAVGSDGETTLVKNYAGEIEVVDDNGSTKVGAKEQFTFGAPDKSGAVRLALQPRGEFDAWAQDRNGRRERAVAGRHVAPEVIGYEDLDGHGEWESDPTYGSVWYPSRVAVDWSPYRHGNWVWVSPWGWTWVDYSAWGFAPFHYGRWAHVRNRWCWVPGPRHVRAVYAPALVAWVGGAPGVNVSISFGRGIGWFPLAPHEIFVPGYYSSRRYWHRVNHGNTVIVNNIYINRAYTNRDAHVNYRNRGVRNAVTVVNRETFVSARPVHNHRVRVEDRELRNWRVTNAAPAIAPDRNSRFSERGARGAPRSFNVQRERAVTTQRAPVRRASFQQEQAAIRANNNRPIATRELYQREGRPERGDARISRNDRPERNGAERSRPDRAAVERGTVDRPSRTAVDGNREAGRGVNREARRDSSDRGRDIGAGAVAQPPQPQAELPPERSNRNRERDVETRRRTQDESATRQAEQAQRANAERAAAAQRDEWRNRARNEEIQRDRAQRTEAMRRERTERAPDQSRGQPEARREQPVFQQRPEVSRQPEPRSRPEPSVQREQRAPEAAPQPRAERAPREARQERPDRGDRGGRGERGERRTDR